MDASANLTDSSTNAAPRRGSSIPTWALAGGATLIGFLPILVSFFRQQWARPEYQAFPLMLGAAAYFLATRLRDAPPVNRTSILLTLISWLATLGALAGLAASIVIFSPWLAMASFLLFCFGQFLNLWQNWRVPGLWGIMLLLVLLVPPPLDRDQMFIETLQLFSSQMTSLLLDAFGVLHVMSGNTLSLGDKQLFVDEACSGIVSLISIVYCIAIFCVWLYRSPLHTITLMAVGVAWTIMMNTLRLTTIGLAWEWYRVDWAEGVPHTLLAVVLFAISVGVMYAVDRFLLELFAPVDTSWREQDPEERHPGLSLMRLWDQLAASHRDDEELSPAALAEDSDNSAPSSQAESRKRLTSLTSSFGLPVTGCFAILGLSYLAFFSFNEASIQAAVDRSLDRALALDQDFDPCRESGLTLTGFSGDRRELFRWDLWGQYSRTYTYAEREGVEYQISCDFLFGPHWHDLRSCYRGTGWKIRDERIVAYDDLGKFPREERVVESSLTAPWILEQFAIDRPGELRKGVITYGAFRATGDWFNRPRGAGLWQDFWAHIVQGRDRAEQADYYQIQVTLFYDGELNPDDLAQSERVLKMALNRFRNELTAERDAGARE